MAIARRKRLRNPLAPAAECRPHRVAVLALNTVVTFDLAVPCTVFGHAPIGAPVNRLYDVRVCAAQRDITSADGFVIRASATLRALHWADTVVVPGFTAFSAPLHPTVVRALQSAHARGARIISICTGAFALAAAGLLDGRRATTHWGAAQQLAESYPFVDVDPDALYVDEGIVCTSAGVAAGIDLCLHLVRKDFGTAAANAIARLMVTAPHRRGGQTQFAEKPVPVATEAPLDRTREWMLAHLKQPVTIDALAKRAGMSRRSFSRHFLAETGTSPLQWLLDQRVLLSRRLLETTNESIDRVATMAGFGTALSLRQHFKRATGTTPQDYRNTFRGAT